MAVFLGKKEGLAGAVSAICITVHWPLPISSSGIASLDDYHEHLALRLISTENHFRKGGQP